MSEICTVIIIYAHDDDYYNTCVYDRKKYKFIYEASMEKLTDHWREPLRYRNDPIYVHDAVIMPMGVAFLRVYHNYNDNYKNFNSKNCSKRTILGYEHKLTISMYDVPYKSHCWF